MILGGCVSNQTAVGADGRPLPVAYKIGPNDVSRVTYSMIDSANRLRATAGAPPLTLNAQLTAAAATHSLDMSVQNRPWHFGSDGSSPILRVQRTGYAGRMLGENISETFENEIETLTAWMSVPDTAAVILDPAARDVGFSWHQEKSGKIWWTLVTGG
ncbi:MAG: CAP domain-containing protein [Paracoccaceae bacterium]